MLLKTQRNDFRIVLCAFFCVCRKTHKEPRFQLDSLSGECRLSDKLFRNIDCIKKIINVNMLVFFLVLLLYGGKMSEIEKVLIYTALVMIYGQDIANQLMDNLKKLA